MEEAYRVGVTLALNGGTGKIVQRLIEDFTKLDKVIQRTNTSLNTLVSGMRLLRREAEGTANALKGAATAMERAARATSRGRSGGVYGGGSSRTPGTGFTTLGDPYTPLGGQGPSRPPPPGIPYQRPALPQRMSLPYGQALSGGGYTAIPPAGGGFYGSGAGTRFYGPGTPGYTIIPPNAPGGAGGPPAPRGPTIQGAGGRPGAASYGPYGPPFGGNAGYPPVPPIPPFPGQPPGPQPPRPGAFNVPSGSPFGSGHPYHSAAAAYGGFEFLKTSIEKGVTFEDWMHRLEAQGFSAQQARSAGEEAFSVQRKVLPSTVGGNLQLLSELMSVVQNPAESMQLLPQFAQLQSNYARAGNAAGVTDMLSAMKAGEYRGVLSGHLDQKTGETVIDTTALQQFVKNLLVTSTITGSTVGAPQILQFLRSSGYTGANISDTSLFAKSIALIQALSPGGAGTALRGFEQQFTAGKMSDAAANLLMQMHVLLGGPKVGQNPYVTKTGIGHVFVDPRAFPPGLQMEATKEPDEFITKYLFPKISDFLAKKLGDQYTKASDADKRIMEQNYAGTLASTQTGAKELAETFRVISLINRDTEAYKKALDRPIEETLKSSPKNEVLALPASIDALQTALSKPVVSEIVSGFNAITIGVNAISKWAEANPTGSKVAMEGLAAGIAGLGVGSVAFLAMAALSGPAGMLAALAAGLVALKAGVDALVKAFPDPKSKEEWANVPGTRFWFQKKFHDITGLGSAPTGPLDQTGPAAPVVPTMENRGARATPVPVHITNPGDLTHSVGQGLSHSMNKPQGGISGFDTSTSDINGLYYGLAGVP